LTRSGQLPADRPEIEVALLSLSVFSRRAVVLVAIATAATLLSTVAGRRWIALPIVVTSTLLLVWLSIRFAREANREQWGSDELRRANETLEAQIEARTADLRDSHERLRSIIESAVDAIIVIDDKGLVESFNPGAEALFGYAESEVVGRNVKMLMPSPYHEEHDGYLNRYLTTGTAKIIGIGREVTGQRRDGSFFPAHLSVGEMSIGGRRKFTGILHDLTTRLRIEEQLRERAALARVGEMAAVIAHEVKNPLAGVRGAIQVIRGRLSNESRDGPILAEIVTRIDALDDLIKDLLLFARPTPPRRVAVDVIPLVSMTANLICQDPSLRDMQVKVEGSSPPVHADAEMLKIVFQNLLTNAAHAMQGKGTVRVTVSAADSSCLVVFADTGPGIPADIRDKIFTAFFTTKARGSGLGLATAKRLVEAHQGEIAIECPPAGGTKVTVRLPTYPN
jgi:two-component system, LuxR family, sensor kinase FixL